MTELLAEIEPETFMPVCRQAELFLLSVLLGGGMGVLYDVFRALRAIFPPLGRVVPTAVCDIIFLLLCGLGIFLFSILCGDGLVRGYYLLGAFLGMTIYLLTAGTVVIGIIRTVFGGIYRVLGGILRRLGKPLAGLFKKISTKKGYKFVTNAKKLFPK
ncbi:MAG: spore cortex biosynthesis protein YabQ [Oscillospiraceae bacterium]|nr:spore cortex biosynthesis protein YabQ [Oscillospiraceae bacterium]